MPSTIGIISHLTKERNCRYGNYLNFSIIIQLTSLASKFYITVKMKSNKNEFT